MEKQERKKKIGNLPETTEAYKKKFIEKLENGYSASIAAKMIDVSRKTVYNWRNGDPEFAADWDDAIEAAIDLVETRLYQRAIKHSDSNAQCAACGYLRQDGNLGHQRYHALDVRGIARALASARRDVADDRRRLHRRRP